MTVADPISTSEKTSIFLRPIRSPKWPKTMAPAGRETKATPKVANAARVPDSGLSVGKNATPEHQGRCGPEDEEVVPLDRGSDEARERDLRPVWTEPTSASSVTVTSNLPWWFGAPQVLWCLSQL